MSGQEGNGIPLAVASALVVLFLFCGISEYARLNLIAVGVRDAVQEAILSTVNDNYDDVYHGVREGTQAVTIHPGEAGMKVWIMVTYMDSWMAFWEWRTMEVIM